MSDSPQGPGWWQASDGKWYPPEQAPGYQAGGAGGGPTTPSADVGSALGYGFNKFVQNIGDWIVIWLVLVAAIIVLTIVGVAIGIGAGVSGFSFSLGGLVIRVVQGIVTGVLLVVIAKGAIAVTKGERPEVGKCFQLSGNNIVAGVVFGLIYGALSWFCWPVGAVAFIFLGFLPVISADQDRGADALSEAVQTATGRFGETILVLLVAWLLTGICGLGAPIGMLSLAYVYKGFRGEQIAA